MESVNIQNDFKTTSKKWTDKKKTNLICVFCKSIWIPRKQIQRRSKEYLGNKTNSNNNNNNDNNNNNNNKVFLGKDIGHNEHYMIHTGVQRPKIAGNWPLTSPYLQRWFLPLNNTFQFIT